MLVVVVAMHGMPVPVVHVVDMAAVLDGVVPAGIAVNVVVR